MTALTLVTADGSRHPLTGEPAIIAAAALFLADGRARVEKPDGSDLLPYLPPGDKLRWFRECFSADLSGVLQQRRVDVAKTLQTIGTARAKFLAGVLLQATPGAFDA